MEIFRRRISWVIGAVTVLMAAAHVHAGTAKLTVQTKPPGALVYLDGNNTGVRTPARLMVEPGKHRLRLVKSGYHPLTRTIEVYSDIGFASFNLKPDRKQTPNNDNSHNNHARHHGRTNRVYKPAPKEHGNNTRLNSSDENKKRHQPVRNVRVIRRGTYQKSSKPKRQEPTTLNALPKNNPFKEWIKKNESRKKSNDKARPLPAKPEKVPEERQAFPLIKSNKEKKTIKNEAEKNPAAEALKEDPSKEDQTAETVPPFPEAAESRDVSARKDKADLNTLEEKENAPSNKSADDASGLEEQQQGIRRIEAPEDIETGEELDGPLIAAPAPEVEWPPSAESTLYSSARGLPHFPEKFNVLLLGLDRRDRRGILATGAKIPLKKLRRKPANADVIMVFQLDFIDNQVRAISIPRDTRVYIPRHGYRKMNAAYAYGREKLARRVVESFLDIEIHRTVTADWRGAKKNIALFKRLGLDYHGYSEKEMFWHLRKRSFRRGDFRRIERQQKFMRYALSELLRLYNRTRQAEGTSAMVKKNLLDMAIKKALEELITDFTEEEIHILAYAMRDYEFREMSMGKVRGRGGRRHGRYYYFPYRNHSFDDIVARIE